MQDFLQSVKATVLARQYAPGSHAVYFPYSVFFIHFLSYRKHPYQFDICEYIK